MDDYSSLGVYVCSGIGSIILVGGGHQFVGHNKYIYIHACYNFTYQLKDEVFFQINIHFQKITFFQNNEVFDHLLI